MLKAVVGKLLYNANANSHVLSKEHFYRLKDALLKRFALPAGHDAQYIEKKCWSCAGTGTFAGFDNGVRWIARAPQPCTRCVKGIYERYWIVLARFSLGERLFHKPIHRVSQKTSLPPQIDHFIEGYIKHAPVDAAVSAESFLWLALVFEPFMLFSIFGTHFIEPSSHGLYPLTRANNLLARGRQLYFTAKWRLTRAQTKLKSAIGLQDQSDLPF